MNGTNLVKAFVPLPGGATAVYNSSGSAWYRHADWLGSSRLASTPSQGMYYDGAYSPTGEIVAESGTADRNFTGQNADLNPDLYDFLFRELRPGHGRWVSPDPAGVAAVDPADPQSWNRYAYVGNDPVDFSDPTGLLRDPCAEPEMKDDPFCAYKRGTNATLMPSWVLAPRADGEGLGHMLILAWVVPPSSLNGGSAARRGGRVSGGDKAFRAAEQFITAPEPCSIVDGYEALQQSLEFKFKVGPGIQAGPVKAGFSLYKNLTTGARGGVVEMAVSGLISGQSDIPAPYISDAAHSLTVLGMRFSSSGHKFSPSFSYGVQFGVGLEVVVNPDTYDRIARSNARCRGY